ncbi:MerR family transcriptional regulator [Clavibacter michiganensis]|uniref:MerR family transcriptional regulator n=1 Tax=Clavibacter michiganensis TaxID=28447 RepID=UPI000B6BECBC|nr:MerR family transcriptional regulator [Clavibacter michiganensis]MDO4033349.1 MerR family transcriptional regulator [Clavibacter michiganensis]MDO4082720.1 MerR family transcriptional regulator [Clavibacter michiganensis]MDO4089023.1 MerR family transcriptional regulator [Clavibacter michiganensis]MDO4098227.1 MerR family transcriptional regulator [Clavibacter michiganensis]MDO4100682.1 MerR family transcriptional regulator [Clavibacter michiganensis]
MTHPAETHPAETHPTEGDPVVTTSPIPMPTPPRRVRIGDAAAFVGITPRTIRHYHQIGLIPEPERGTDDRRRYGYADMVRLMWIRRMADAGIALEDIRAAFADPEAGEGAAAAADTAAHAAPAAAGDDDVADVLGRLEATLAAQEAELRRQRDAVRRLRARGSRLGLLSDLVARRLDGLPEGALRQADLDALLVMERSLGTLVAALNATRYIAVATLPGLREASDRVDAAEEALDDTVAVDDPRVAEVAAERRAFEEALQAAIDASDLPRQDEELVAAWDELHPDGEGDEDEARGGSGRPARSLSTMDAFTKMPYDFSPARLRSMELATDFMVWGPPGR